MRTPLDPRRSTVSLTVASPSEATAEDHPRIPHVPWLLAALVWGAAVAASGWVAVGALVGVAWVTAPHIAPVEVLATTGQGWLAVHGAAVTLGGATLRMVPLGLTLLLVAGCAVAAHHAAGQYQVAPDAPARRRALAWAALVGACAGAYALVGGVIAAVVGEPGQLGQALPGLLLVPLVGAAVGARLGLGFDPHAALPPVVRRLLRSLSLGVAVLAAGSLVALAVTLVAHWPQVSALHRALDPGVVGTVLLVLVQLAHLPNLLVWAGAFVLGAGVRLGADGLVAPGVVEPTLLPAVPVLGALPQVSGPADWAWLAVGVAAAGASAWWQLKGTPPAWPAGLWQGAVAGMAPGVVWVLLSSVAGGDLGADLLAGVGPRFPHLFFWAVVPLAVAGALWGVGRALWLARRAPAPVEEPSAIG